jgi:hypothetical protein
MSVWTVYPYAVACGICGEVIPDLQPVLEMRPSSPSHTGKMRRCAYCATVRQGIPVNHDEVELEKARLDLETARAAERREHALAHPRPIVRIPAPRPPRPFRSLGDVGLSAARGKAAAAGRDA